PSPRRARPARARRAWPALPGAPPTRAAVRAMPSVSCRRPLGEARGELAVVCLGLALGAHQIILGLSDREVHARVTHRPQPPAEQVVGGHAACSAFSAARRFALADRARPASSL